MQGEKESRFSRVLRAPLNISRTGSFFLGIVVGLVLCLLLTSRVATGVLGHENKSPTGSDAAQTFHLQATVERHRDQSVANKYLDIAESLSEAGSGARGDARDGGLGNGDLGWLLLLSALSVSEPSSDPGTFSHILENIVENYRAAKYPALGMVLLMEQAAQEGGVRNVAKRLLRDLKKDYRDEWERLAREDVTEKGELSVLETRDASGSGGALVLPSATVAVPFATLVSSWRLLSSNPSLGQSHDDFYERVMHAYRHDFMDWVADREGKRYVLCTTVPRRHKGAATPTF